MTIQTTDYQSIPHDLPQLDQQFFPEPIRNPLTKSLFTNVLQHAAIGYVVTGGNPLALAAGLGTGSLTTFGQWISGKCFSEPSTTKVEQCSTSTVGVGTMLLNTGISLAISAPKNLTDVGITTAKSIGAFFTAKVATVTSDTILDVCQVNKDSSVRPLINGVVGTAVGVGTAYGIDKALDVLSPDIPAGSGSGEQPTEPHNTVRQRRQAAPMEDTCPNELPPLPINEDERTFTWESGFLSGYRG